MRCFTYVLRLSKMLFQTDEMNRTWTWRKRQECVKNRRTIIRNLNYAYKVFCGFHLDSEESNAHLDLSDISAWVFVRIVEGNCLSSILFWHFKYSDIDWILKTNNCNPCDYDLDFQPNHSRILFLLWYFAFLLFALLTSISNMFCDH